MTFRLGRREGTAGCGAECAEFVYAEGTIFADSAQAYAAALAATKKKDLPVYFASPGGSMKGGMALGRAMRRNGATAVVAMMNPADCGKGTAICSPQDKWAGVAVFKAETEKAYCNSACAWAIVGAKVRSLQPGSSFGVHQFYQAENTGDKPNPLAKYSYAQLQDVQRTSGALVNYLVEMGVSPELFSVAASVPATSVRGLSASELARYKVIDSGAKPFALPDLKLARATAPPPAATQRFAAWTLAAAGKDSLLSAEVARQSARHGPVTTRLALGCTRPDGRMPLRLEEVATRGRAALAPGMMFIGTTAQKLAILNPATSADASTDRKLIDEAATAGALELRLLYSSGLLTGIDARDSIALAGTGLADALSAMDKSCGANVATN